MSVTIDGAGSLIGVDQGLNIVGLTTLTGGIILDDSISHIGDTNTKIRFPAADTITAETGGTERLRIDSNGNIGVGVNNPSSFNSDGRNLVVGTGSGGQGISIYSANNSYGTIYFADGTSGSELYRGGLLYNHAFDFLRFDTAGAEKVRITSAGTLESYSPDDTTPNIRWRSDDTNWFGALNQSVHGGTITSFLSCGGDWTANGTTYSATKALAAYPTSAIAVHNQYNSTWGSEFVFLTKAGGSSTTDGAVTERLRITSGGTVDVTGKLRIDISNGGTAGSGTAEGIFLRNTQETDNNAVTIFGGADDYNAAASAINFINVDHSANAGDISFDTRSTSNSYAERLRITSTGKIGIGVNSPVEMMEITNTGGAGSQIQFRGTSTGTGAGDGARFGYNGSGAQIWNFENTYIRFATNNAERLRITSAGVIQCGTSATLKAEINNAVSGHQFISQCSDNNNGFEIYQQHGSNTTRNTFAVYANTGSSNAKNLQFGVRGDGNVGVGIDNPSEHLHISGAVRRDTPGTSNIKFLEFSFELPSGSTTTIARVTGPVVSSMAIAKFEYVGLYDYADVGFYSGVEMASLRRSNSNSAYTYLQNSEIHAGGNNSSYQPNMFWQNGSNNTSDLMITTGSYVIIVGTIRITTFNLGFTRVISV